LDGTICHLIAPKETSQFIQINDGSHLGLQDDIK